MSGATIRVEVIRPNDSAWDARLEHIRCDVFHSSGYHSYSETSGEGEAYLVIAGDANRALAWPYLLRRVGEEHGSPEPQFTDVGSVYGYPGPLSWGCVPGDPFIGRAWREIQEVWRSQGAITAFTRFHPILGNASLALGMAANGTDRKRPDPVVANGRTVSIDLTVGYEGVRAAYGRDLRREIDHSIRTGLEVSVDRDWRELGTFARLYNQTMARLGAADYYLFQESDFRRLRNSLDGHLHLLVARFEGKVVAAGLFTEWREIVEWYLVGTDADYAAMSPSKPLVDFAITWAIERGAEILHLGGGRGGGEDSLLWFKSRFSPRRHTFHTGRWVLDVTATKVAIEARRARLAPGVLLDPSYFPQY
ncbi:MAG: GNAT family N-acetyltransferase, partial [bacterium]